MDAVELPLPAAVAVSTLMGSEGCGSGGVGVGIEVTVEEVEALTSGGALVPTRPCIDKDKVCSSFTKKDGKCGVNSSQPAFWTKMSNIEYSRQGSSHAPGEDVSEEQSNGSTNTSTCLKTLADSKQFQKKSVKAGRNSSGCLKRSRMLQVEVSKYKSVEDNAKGVAASPATCNLTEKNQTVKQKNISAGRRADRRNVKLLKSNFSLKNGLVSFNSAAGGNSILGAYGLKPDFSDATENIDEPSVRELLDGSYNHPLHAKDNGKKEGNPNENLLQSVRKAFSLLKLQKAAGLKNCLEVDNNHGRMLSAGSLHTGTTSANRNECEKQDTGHANLSSGDKESHSMAEEPDVTTDSLSQQPIDVLKRLALPPPKDLDSLLFDAAKPAASSKNSLDLRLSKPISQRTGLPPFSWSHTYSGHCKSGSDAAKMSASKAMCQGKWLRVQNVKTPPEGSSGFLVPFETLAYNPSLVSLEGPDFRVSPPDKPELMRVTMSSSEMVPSSSMCSIPQGFSGAGEHSPRALAAAQILSEMATHTGKQSSNRMMTKLLKKSPTIKACKLKSNEKSGKLPYLPKGMVGSESLAEIAEGVSPLKKVRLAADAKSDGINHQINSDRKGPVSWSAPRAMRSSPSKLFRESPTDAKSYNNNFVNKTLLMPPPTRVVDKVCSSQQKLKKVVPVEWNRGSSKLG